MMKESYKDYYKNHYKSTFTKADIDEWVKWFDSQWRFINKKTRLKRKMRVLEIGPGFGGFYHVLQQHGSHEYLGLDLDPDIVKFTNKFYKTTVFKYKSIEDLRDNKGFDLIVAFEVLEHVENPGNVANKISKLLKPGGMFIGTTPYPFRRNIISDATHISVLHPENWRRVFNYGGFRQVQVFPMSYLPFLWRLHSKLNIRIPFFLPIRGLVSTSLIIAKK